MNNAIEHENLVNDLLLCIERLEINEARLEQEVETLRSRVQATENQIDNQPAIEAEVVDDIQPTQQRNRVIARDRDGRQLQLRDPVYILTRGVHRERRGTIYKLGTDRVIILDRNGIQQSRAPHNVRYTGDQA